MPGGGSVRGGRAIVVALALLATAAPARATIPSGNLVQNPGAESPDAPASDTGVAAPTGWQTLRSNLTVMAYGRTAFPPTSVSDAIGGQTNFFAGGPDSAATFATQTVDVSAASAEIDAGHVDLDLSAYLGGAANQDDAATVTVNFNTATSGTSAGTPVTVGPVTAADRGNVTTLLRREQRVTVPAGTRSLAVVIRTTRAAGAYDDGYADNISVVLSDNTAAPPPPPPPPPGNGGNGSGGAGGSADAPPQVTAIHTVAPLVAGETTVVSADVSGSARRLLWDINGDGKPDVGCDAAQTTLAFRPPKGAAGVRRISVQAVGDAGRGDAFAQSLTVTAEPPPASPVEKRIRSYVSSRPAVTACGKAADLPAFPSALDSGLKDRVDAQRCHVMTLHAGLVGGLEVTGCFFRMHSLADVPPAERSIFSLFSATLHVSSQKLLARVPHLFADATTYRALGSVLIDGTELTPKGGASIIVVPSFYKVISSNAAFTVGGIPLKEQPDFILDATPGAGQRIPVGTFPRLSGGVAALGGFSLAGDVGVTLLPGTPETPAGAEIRAHLQLPAFLDLGGVHVQGNVTLRVTDDGSLVLDDLRIGPIDAAIGPLGVNGLQIDYARATQEWKGQGELCVVVACLDAREIPGEAPPGGVLIRHGQLVRAYANLNFPDPGITLFAGVQLNRIGAGIGLGPPRFLGGARLTALGILRIDGALVLALPTTAEPFFLTREENGDAFPANFYGRPYNRFTLALGADASLKVPIIDDPIALAKAYFLYEAPGYVAFGGGVDANFIDVLSLSGGVDGEFNAENGRFNLSGHIRACVADVVCAGAIAYLSSVGVGGCVTLDALFADINVGGGVVYNPFDIKLWPFDGCRWTRFKDDHVFTARAAQAGGGAMTVHIVAGQRSRAVALDSSDGAARVRVTGPGGMIAETPAGPGLTLKPKVRIMRSEKLHQTVVGLVDPAPGDYRIEVLPDSPAITNVSEATDPPPAQVTAHVRGRGARRVLAYDIARRPRQSVTFVEVSGVARRPIGTVSGGRGTLSFTPAPGKDLRHVVAQFSLDGIRTETKTVASFRPPSPFLARPGHLHVRRRGSSLRVSWAPVAGAAHYEVVTTPGSAGQRITRARGAHASVRNVPLTSAGRVSVRAVAPMRQGSPTSARFGATKRLKTRFARLPRS